MSHFPKNFRKHIPPFIKSSYRKMRSDFYGLVDLQFWDKQNNMLPGLGWNSHPQAYVSRRKFEDLKNAYDGERCFIIGNGPSINLMNLNRLRNEITFGLNRIFLLFPRLGFTTSYLVSVNRLVVEQSKDDFVALPILKFISWHARKYIGFHPDVIYIRDAYDGTTGFATNPTKRIWEGATVTFVAMQIAYYLGFTQVYLIGIDHSFQIVGEPHKEVISTGPDSNHFDPNYFGNGFRWNLPDLTTSESSYELARQFFERDGREILDATVNGRLNVFPKVDFDSLF